MYSIAGTLLIMFFMKCIRLEVCKCYALEKTSCEEFDKRFYKSPKCGFRHEVQYDYAKFYNVKDCSNFTYCLCQKPIYVRYAEFPPYIYEVNNGSANNVEGILPGNLE